jgi:hypothetical protein
VRTDVLQKHSGFVTSVKGDVSSVADVAFLFEASGKHRHVTGVVHAGGVLSDSLLARQTAGSVYGVFAPKNAGAENIWAGASLQPVSSNVAFSSVAALFGSSGQANYAVGLYKIDPVYP